MYEIRVGAIESEYGYFLGGKLFATTETLSAANAIKSMINTSKPREKDLIWFASQAGISVPDLRKELEQYHDCYEYLDYEARIYEFTPRHITGEPDISGLKFCKYHCEYESESCFDSEVTSYIAERGLESMVETEDICVPGILNQIEYEIFQAETQASEYEKCANNPSCCQHTTSEEWSTGSQRFKSKKAYLEETLQHIVDAHKDELQDELRFEHRNWRFVEEE